MFDPTDTYLKRVITERNSELQSKFHGQYIAEVVETNDPLNMHRIKFKCPELHDWDIKTEEAPWATVAFMLGGKRAGFWTHPCIGDNIIIEFEKGHPYSPICVGFANPTRRRMYTYPSLYSESPISVNQDGKPDKQPTDYSKEYLPSDRRPMSTGINDRYGNLDIISSVGYFPIEHDIEPPPPGHDALSGKSFESKSAKPLVNAPDKKYMSRLSKYGMLIVQSDQGYYWKKDSTYGEFNGNFNEDEEFETNRWLYYQRLLNEDSTDKDARRISINTRYGHLFEMRDVGWAQSGPKESKSRNEYGEGNRYLSKNTDTDMRWIKIRSKAGMLFQMIDIGADPANDEYIKRQLIDEVGDKVEKENEYWKDRDARQLRLISRHGYKIVLDDRGSSTTAADTDDTMRGNGILIKGKRPAIRGEASGFYWEFNENDQANHTSWGTPNGRSVELNDRYGYIMMAASMGSGWAAKWEGVKDNEFIRKPLMLNRPEENSYHVKLDDINKYIRIKTGENGNQGLESRDSNDGPDGIWTEIVGKDNRGLWLSDRYKLSIMRASDGYNAYIMIDEINNNTVIFNNSGDIKISSTNKIEIVSGSDINLQSKGSISLNASDSIKLKGGSCTLAMRGSVATFSDNIYADNIYANLIPEPRGQAEDMPSAKDLVQPQKLLPTDRGYISDQNIEECPLDEVRHPY